MLGLGNSLITTGGLSEVLPSEISGLAIWYKNNTGVAVGQWDDSSGNGRHAVQADADEQAAVSGGGLSFDGADPEDHYAVTESTGYVNPGGTNAFTIAFVATREGGDGDDNAIIAGSYNDEYLGFLDEEFVTFRSQDASNFTFATDTWVSSTQWLFTVTKDTSGNFLFWKNGVSVTPTSTSGTIPNTITDFNAVKLFGARPPGDSTSSFTWDGIIYEFVMYDTQLTGNDLANLNSYLTSKFGL